MTDLENLLNDLSNSSTEEDITNILTKIIKGFSTNLYRDRIITNPYYRSLLLDIKISVLSDIEHVRNSIISEISDIDSEISKVNPKFIKKLNELKTSCISLVSEIDLRRDDILENII